MVDLEYKDCPRCGKNRLHPSPMMNSLSRQDDSTYICSPCASHEALLDAARHNPAFALQLAEFVSDDLDEPFKLLTAEQEADLWVRPCNGA